MKCRVCLGEVTCTCLCGFCYECIKNYGHDNCEKWVKDSFAQGENK